MALQWMLLRYVVIAILLTLPYPKALKSRFVSLTSLALQPSIFVLNFSVFQLLGIHPVDFYVIYKAQRNAIFCLAADLLYWCIYRVCKYYKEIQSIEEVEKRYKDQ